MENYFYICIFPLSFNNIIIKLHIISKLSSPLLDCAEVYSNVLKYFNSIIHILFDEGMWNLDVSGICNVWMTHVHDKYPKDYNKQEETFMYQD